jgi:hypothetical protein
MFDPTAIARVGGEVDGAWRGACEKAYAGIVSGVLVCLFSAPSREALDEFQKRHGMVPEHLWRIDLESQDGQLVSA